MAPISGFITFSLILTIVYFLGFLTYITDNEKNRCEMTYMFQYPQLVKIETNFDWKYKKYGLYAYSEGIHTARVRQMHFDGIPVLFIPGNSGSFRQVRSFASVALRKSLDDKPGFHFDFFALNLNQEFSALNGAVLNEQTEYANFSIFRILELYSKNRIQPSSVIIMGHSMGGIIAQGLLLILPKTTVVPLIITLATPHRRPPIALDYHMVEYYDKLQTVDYVNTTIIALSGGYNDILVAPFMTHRYNLNDIDIVTTSVPLVWIPVDHLCILWCRQLVLTVTRSLFQLVDTNKNQITLDKDFQMEVFNHHLIRNSGVKVRQMDSEDLSVNFKRTDSDWIENLREQYTVSLKKGTKKPQWHMIRLINQPEFEFVTILTSNLKIEKWVFACSALHLEGQHRICKNGTHLSHLSEIAPSVNYKRRILNINLHELKRSDSQLTHVVIKVLPTNEPIAINVDRYNLNKRVINVDLPRWWTLTTQTILTSTEEKVIFYELVFPQLQHIIQSYRLYITPFKCTVNNHHATVNLHIPWSKQNVYNFVNGSEKEPLHLRLYTSKPSGMNNSVASVKLTLDPGCVYSIKVSNSILGTLSQIARTYSPLIVANMAAVIILTFRNQLVSIETCKSCTIFFVAIKKGVKPYYILTTVKVVSRILSWNKLSHILPVPDWHIIADEGNDFFILPLILYMCSVGIVWILALILAVSLFVYESTFYRAAAKFLAKTVTGVVTLSNWLIGGLQKLPCVVAAFLVMLSISSCGALALCLGCGFYFLKLTHMSQEYVEDLCFKLLKYLVAKIKTKFSRNQIDEVVSSQTVAPVAEIEASGESDNEVEEVDSNKEMDEDVKKVKFETGGSSSSEAESDEDGNEEESEEIKNNGRAEENKANTLSLHSGIFFHFSIFLLWCMVAVLNVPYILTWAHNFKFSSSLNPDPSFLPGIILSICAFPLWQMELPKPNIRWYNPLGHILNILAAASLIYAPISIYRLIYIITTTIVLITLHQVFSPKQIEVEDINESETPSHEDPKKLLTDMKVKWE